MAVETGKGKKAKVTPKSTKTKEVEAAKRKKDGDEFFATDTKPSKSDKPAKHVTFAVGVNTSTSDASPPKATPKDQKKQQKNGSGTTKEMRSGVVSVIDKVKKMSKKARKSTVDDVVAALEGSSGREESLGTGLDVGGWD